MTQHQVRHYAKLHLLSRITSVMHAIEHAELQSVREEFERIHYQLECEMKELDKDMEDGDCV